MFILSSPPAYLDFVTFNAYSDLFNCGKIQKETKKKHKNVHKSYILRKKNRKEDYYKTDDEHDTIRSTLKKHVHYRDQVRL